MPPKDQNSSPQSQMKEVVDRLNEANNVLVTVSNNPSVDQLAACIGLTVALNKKDKHATAVFSGAVPSTIDFLEPEKTLEKNTDSLRDFIIALDKAKADKLRYKVEDDVVKIFITPYKTSISEADLEFSQGDFNVDAVVALGVHTREELDAAIVAHGRILHDATVISVNIADGGELGSIHWQESKSSSLSEMACDLVVALDDKILDSQIATSFLTGIVAETDRFRNEKSSPHTMTVSGTLMSAGASTQLVSSKLEEAVKVNHAEDESSEDNREDDNNDTPEEPPKPDDGTIQIEHDDDIHIDDSGQLAKASDILQKIDEEAQAENNKEEEDVSLPELADLPDAPPLSGPSMIHEPPSFGGQLTANTEKVDQQYISVPDPLTAQPPPQGHTLSHDIQPPAPQPVEQTSPEPAQAYTPPEPPVSPIDAQSNQTLSELEKSLNSPHALEYQETPLPPLPPAPEVPAADPNYAREAVERAAQGSSDYKPEPIQALGSSQLGAEINHDSSSDSSSGTPPPPVPPPLPVA